MTESMNPNPEDVRTIATRVLRSPCHFIHNTDTNPYSSGEYTVYALETSGNTRVAIRIPKNRISAHAAFLLNREAEFRRRIDNARIPLFQPLITFSYSHENLLGAPFLAAGWTDGTPLP
ncbi:hypothetical protein F53441_9635 [Fusarium austroafricanum]|uniref:Aminoglycoside phosphotransferase domain-containing protein n=1 Tax=Fusarium austroafricanum TaxID=2364996 RepID=A0A8H4P351_9HYPO|nr:hypothetical protein F53441_9635 [Fusarium austroafricanum]